MLRRPCVRHSELPPEKEAALHPADDLLPGDSFSRSFRPALRVRSKYRIALQNQFFRKLHNAPSPPMLEREARRPCSCCDCGCVTVKTNHPVALTTSRIGTRALSGYRLLPARRWWCLLGSLIAKSYSRLWDLPVLPLCDPLVTIDFSRILARFAGRVGLVPLLASPETPGSGMPLTRRETPGQVEHSLD